MKRRTMKSLVLCLTLLFIMSSGCTDSSQVEEARQAEPPKETARAIQQDRATEETTAETATVILLPEKPTKGTRVYANLFKKSSEVTYEWYVNGFLYKSGKEAYLDTSALKKGDSIMVKAITPDGEFTSEEIEIQNSPPVIRGITIGKEIRNEREVLVAVVYAEDPDGDPITLSYEWKVNGEVVQNNSSILETELKASDRVTLRVIPSDGETTGPAITRTYTLYNAPPVVTGDITFTVEDSVVKGKIPVEDPDGDPLSFIIKKAPEGFRIDSSGEFRWNIPENSSGDFPVTILVKDNKGGESTVQFTLTVTVEEVEISPAQK